jgi:hypothetical protein
MGVARQYCGTIGKVDNCQVGVFAAYTASKGSPFNMVWVFRMMTLACGHATFLSLPYESACNPKDSMSTKRQ